MKKLFNTRINEIRDIIVLNEESVQMINFKMKYLKITTYAKNPMKQCV